MRYFSLTFVLLLLFGTSVVADEASSNWHQWRGPEATGVAPHGKPPKSWSETENVQWKVEVEGNGTSTPIIWGENVFVLTTVETDQKDASIPDPQDQPKTNFFDIKKPNRVHEYVVLCLERNTGKVRWRQVAAAKIPHDGAHNDNDFAPASPTTDGEHVYCWFGSAGLFCFDLDGNKLWKRDLGEIKVGSSLGEGGSPVLHQGNLVIVRDHAGKSAIEVIDAKTGETRWKRERDEGNAWATPRVVEHSGKQQVITAASNAIRSYDLSDGDLIWECGGLSGNVIPCPVVDGDHVICMSGYQGYAAIAIPLSLKGDLTDSNQLLWRKSRATPYIPSPLLYDGLLYYNQSNQAIISCVHSETGENAFGPSRVGELSNLYSSPVGADGHVFWCGRDGTVVVMKKSVDLEVVAVNHLEERFDASPAIAGNQLFLRGAKHLYCLSE
ncbi:PQQ-like beta-propeller repeat protein [bacterium]|nr:PQQ-like beta-propeller repeat protein [bacterium]